MSRLLPGCLPCPLPEGSRAPPRAAPACPAGPGRCQGECQQWDGRRLWLHRLLLGQRDQHLPMALLALQWSWGAVACTQGCSPPCSTAAASQCLSFCSSLASPWHLRHYVSPSHCQVCPDRQQLCLLRAAGAPPTHLYSPQARCRPPPDHSPQADAYLGLPQLQSGCSSGHCHRRHSPPQGKQLPGTCLVGVGLAAGNC